MDIKLESDINLESKLKIENCRSLTSFEEGEVEDTRNPDRGQKTHTDNKKQVRRILDQDDGGEITEDPVCIKLGRKHALYQCSKCPKKFKCYYVFSFHQKIHEQITCPFCSKVFESEVEVHYCPEIAKKGEAGEMKSESDQVDSSGPPGEKIVRRYRRSALKKKDPKKTTIKCVECQFKFNSSSSYKYHMKHIHSSLRFYCSYCPKSFARNNQLVYHTRRHTGEMPFTCELCEKKFTRESCLKVHLKVHVDVTFFNCDYCQKAFKYKNGLETHMRIHTGEMPYSCTSCGNKFRYRDRFQAHFDRCNAEIKHICQQCGLKFSSFLFYRRHLIVKHRFIATLQK